MLRLAVDCHLLQAARFDNTQHRRYVMTIIGGNCENSNNPTHMSSLMIRQRKALSLHSLTLTLSTTCLNCTTFLGSTLGYSLLLRGIDGIRWSKVFNICEHRNLIACPQSNNCSFVVVRLATLCRSRLCHLLLVHRSHNSSTRKLIYNQHQNTQIFV